MFISLRNQSVPKLDNNIFLLCGEASGDMHAANLVKAMKVVQKDVQVVGWGGRKLELQGVKILKDLSELSFMGFWEVLMNLKKIRRNFRDCKRDIISQNIKTLILVDYPGFNLRIAKWAHQKGIKVIYYISPQVWAWKRNRVFQIKKYVDVLYCILPFEAEFYANYNYPVKYFGHPLLDEIVSFKEKQEGKIVKTNKPILAILPGSRKQEIEKKLPIMIDAALAFKESYDIKVACSSHVDFSFYEKFKRNSISFVYGETYELLSVSTMAIVTSGTATLETALFKVPQVVCYKSSFFSFFIAKRLIQVKYISLVNLIMNKKVVTELIQNDCTKNNIIKELKLLQENTETRTTQIEDYNHLVQLLGNSGASTRIAEDLMSTLS